MKHLTAAGVAASWLFCLLACLDCHALCTIACNDQVNVSLNQEGFAVVLPDMILDGDETYCPGPKIVEVRLPTGQSIGDTVTCSYLGDLLDVRVIDSLTGNYCWGIILVEDKLPPEITCQDTTVVCTADTSPNSIGRYLINDNCDPNPTFSHNDQTILQACNKPFTAIVIRTWQAFDDSGNAATPCVQTIRVARPALTDVVFPPNFDNLDQPALSCENPDTSVLNTGSPMINGLPVTALCKVIAEYTDQVVPQCADGYAVLRAWLVLDCCSGDVLTHTQIIKVMDTLPPVFTCPDTLYFSAVGPGCAGTFILPALPVTDNCAAEITIRITTPNGMIEANGGLVYDLPVGSHPVVYEAQDACANFSNCEITVVVQDDVAPIAVCDEITAVSLNTQGMAEIAAGVFDDGSYDACCGIDFLAKRMDEPLAPFAPNVILDCNDLGDTVMVTVQVTDCKGNANTCMVEVLTDDKAPPSITCPPDITLDCREWLPAPISLTGEPVVKDNCGIDTLYYQDIENLNPCHVGFITRTFYISDISGFSASCPQTITLIDTTASTFFFPADTVVDCSVPLDSISAGQAKALADCELFGLNISDEIFPLECGLKIFRTYTFLDWCSGLDTSYTQLIKVEDTNPPVWDQPQGSKDTAYVCPGDLVKPPPPTATDYCTPVTVTLEKDTTVFLGCDNRFVRTFIWGAVDTCGNVADPFIINLTVFDTLAPTADLPDQGPFECLADIPPFHPDSIEAVDNCPGDVTIELIGETLPQNTCLDTVVRTYRFTDICGLDSIFTQNFLLQDDVPPSATFAEIGLVSCLEFLPPPNESQVLTLDNCGGPVTVNFVTDSIEAMGCSGTVFRKWQLIDGCENDTVVIQMIQILDTIPPGLDCQDSVYFPIIQPVCEVLLGFTIDAVDNCPNRPVTITNDHSNTGAMVSDFFSIGETPVTFYAEDECGNIDSCVVPVIVREFRPPSNECFAVDLALGADGTAVPNVDSLLQEGIIGGEDVCTEVTFDFSPALLDCDDYINNFNPALMAAIIQYTLTVTDAFGNSSPCMNTIFLTDPLDVCDDDGLVAGGLVYRENHQPVPGVEIRLEDATGMNYAYTSEEGWYNFPNLGGGANCTLQPYKNDDLLNGVTTFDLLQITKHILGTKPLGSPYKIIAADINNSGAITTFDLAQLRKAILFISDEFPGNTSWRFIRADYDFPNPANPFAEPFPESAWIANMTNDVYGENFVAVKVGDVNGSVQVNFAGGVDERGGEDFPLTAHDTYLEAGRFYEIPVLAGSETALAALQATLEFDPEKITFNGIAPGLLDLQTKNYAQPKSGSVTLSWDTPDRLLAVPGAALVYLQFTVLKNTFFSEIMAINSTMTPAIAYDNGGNPLNVTWRIREASHSPADAAKVFQLTQNRPNPFQDETRILFLLEESMPVRFEIIDLSGRKTIVLEDDLAPGWQEITLGQEYFNGSGIYFYQLITPYGSERRKMARNQ